MKHVLKIEVGFTDKYTDKEYKVGDEITVDEARGKELLEDPRHLVSLVKKIEESDGSENEKIEEAEKTGEDKELAELKAKAEALGIKVTNNMKKETILKKIEEAEKAGETTSEENEK